MKRQKKKYSRPRKPFDKIRISDENVLKERYGLKNKKEIWKADASVRKIRNLAKELITKSEEEKSAFIERLQKKGFSVGSIADALALDKEDYLKRRLQTVLNSKGLSNTAKQGRQLITHKHVMIGDRTINIPSYQVSLEEESQVKLDIVLKTPPKQTKGEKIKKEIIDGEEVEEKPKTEKEKSEKKVEEKVEEVKKEEPKTEDKKDEKGDKK